jgi:UDP-N-acetylglucosamine:LPS N-acetylglucosamine transferase
MADALRDEVLALEPDAEVMITRDFTPLGRTLGRYLNWSFRVHFGDLGWSYDLTYLLFTRSRIAERIGAEALYRVAGRRLAEECKRRGADVVVAMHPVFNPILAGARRDGLLPVPAATTCCELGGLEFWLQPDLDLHMMIYPEAVPAARRQVHGLRVEAVKPLVSPELYEAPDPTRVASQLPAGEGPLVLISGGGWGLGDLEGATDAALALPGTRVAVVTGVNDELAGRLRQRFANEQRVAVIGHTDHMGDLLDCAEVFVHTTVGLSCLEARLRGRPTICFGLFVGHIRDNASALAAHGYVTLARSKRELTDAISRARHPAARPVMELGSLRSAGEATLALAGAVPRDEPLERPVVSGAKLSAPV